MRPARRRKRLLASLVAACALALLALPASSGAAPPASFFFEPVDYDMCATVKAKIGLAAISRLVGVKLVRANDLALEYIGGGTKGFRGLCGLYAAKRGGHEPSVILMHNATQDFDGESPEYDFSQGGACKRERPTSLTTLAAPARERIWTGHGGDGEPATALCLLWRGAYTQIMIVDFPNTSDAQARRIVARLYARLRQAR
jgi:hypothetical protein